MTKEEAVTWAIHTWVCVREFNIKDGCLSKVDAECMLPRARGMLEFVKETAADLSYNLGRYKLENELEERLVKLIVFFERQING